MEGGLDSLTANFSELRERMQSFQVKFDGYIEQGRARVLQERNDFARNIAGERERQKELTKQIEEVARKQQETAAAVEKEREEADENERAIRELEQRKGNMQTYHSELDEQIQQLRRGLQQKSAAQAKERNAVIMQRAKGGPELSFWQENLCMTIDGFGVKDEIGFTFSHLLQENEEKKFRIVLDLASREYKVISTQPKLPTEALDEALNRLNGTRNLTLFLQEVRALFKKTGARGK